VLENSIALNHISKNHTLLRKLSHTHTHTHWMSWIIYLKFISAGKFVLIENLTLNYIFAYFWIAIWLSYQLFMHTYSEANFREKIIFLQIFLWFSIFRCEASGRTWLTGRTQAAMPITNLLVDHPNEFVPRSDASPLYSLPFTQHYIFFLFFSCCVFLSRISHEILAFCTHLFLFRGNFLVFLCSFKFLYFLEYWNNCWLEYFLEILCMKIIFCLSVGLIFDISRSFRLLYLLM